MDAIPIKSPMTFFNSNTNMETGLKSTWKQKSPQIVKAILSKSKPEASQCPTAGHAGEPEPPGQLSAARKHTRAASRRGHRDPRLLLHKGAKGTLERGASSAGCQEIWASTRGDQGRLSPLTSCPGQLRVAQRPKPKTHGFQTVERAPGEHVKI